MTEPASVERKPLRVSIHGTAIDLDLEVRDTGEIRSAVAMIFEKLGEIGAGGMASAMGGFSPPFAAPMPMPSHPGHADHMSGRAEHAQHTGPHIFAAFKDVIANACGECFAGFVKVVDEELERRQANVS